MNFRPYRLIGDSTLLKAQNHLLNVIEQWLDDWRLDIPVSLTCGRFDGEEKFRHSSYVCYGEEERKIWIDLSMPESISAFLAKEFFSASLAVMEMEQEESMASSISRRAMNDLTGSIVSSCGLNTEPRPFEKGVLANLSLRGAGALVARINIGECAFNMLLSGAVVQIFAPVRQTITLPATVEIQQALADVSVNLPIELGCVETSVASVLALNIGDVVKLSTSLDLPLAVKNDGGAILFNAYLGKREGNLAIEVANRGNV